MPSTGGRPRPRAEQIAAAKARSLLVIDGPAVPDGQDSQVAPEEEEEEQGQVLEDARLVVPTRINPLFLTLGVLDAAREQYLPVDELHDRFEAATPKGCTRPALAYEAFKAAVHPVCEELPTSSSSSGATSEGTTMPDFVRLSLPKLFARLDAMVARVVAAGLPREMHQRLVLDALTPPSTSSAAGDEVSPELVSAAVRRAAMSLVCSNVPPGLSTLYMATADFSALEARLAELRTARLAAAVRQDELAQQGAQVASRKRAAGGGGLGDLLDKKAKTAALTRGERVLRKVNKTGIKSLTSFFGPAAIVKRKEA